jgi:hypothetical protein
MRERTPWFPGSVEPVHEGNYEGEIEMHGSRFPIYPIRWMEGEWHAYLSANSAVGVAWLIVPPGAFGPTFKWRGLTRPAEAQR